MVWDLYCNALGAGFKPNSAATASGQDEYTPGAVEKAEPKFKAENTWIRRIQQAHIRRFGRIPTQEEL